MPIADLYIVSLGSLTWLPISNVPVFVPVVYILQLVLLEPVPPNLTPSLFSNLRSPPEISNLKLGDDVPNPIELLTWK